MDLPVSFADRTRLLLGDEEYNKLADALNDEQPLPGVCPGLPQDFISTVG